MSSADRIGQPGAALQHNQQSHHNHHNHHNQHNGHDHSDHPDMEEIRAFGFWIYLMTDVMIFGTFFAAYVVLKGNTNGGPGPADVFQLNGALISTLILLLSSYTCGLAVLAMQRGSRRTLIRWLGLTALLGALFIGLEINEFAELANEGATMGRSAFLSAFYTLVGTHGLHVTVGLVWMAALMLQLARKGITPVTRRKVQIISLFWHFLDVVWIFVFTVVYLMGVS